MRPSAAFGNQFPRRPVAPAVPAPALTPPKHTPTRPPPQGSQRGISLAPPPPPPSPLPLPLPAAAAAAATAAATASAAIAEKWSQAVTLLAARTHLQKQSANNFNIFIGTDYTTAVRE